MQNITHTRLLWSATNIFTVRQWNIFVLTCKYFSGVCSWVSLLLLVQVQQSGRSPRHLRSRPLLAWGRQQREQVRWWNIIWLENIWQSPPGWIIENAWIRSDQTFPLNIYSYLNISGSSLIRIGNFTPRTGSVPNILYNKTVLSHR